MQNKYIYQYKDQVGNVRLSFYNNGSGAAVIDRTSDFYPFGLAFGGESTISTFGSQSPNYLYAFQGQERQQETGWDSFKWRNYDPSMARFFNVDPLSEKYTHNSTYAFSENRVIDAVELEGLEAWLIHGTWSDNSTFSRPVIDLAKNIGNGNFYYSPWSGENNKFARTQAATALYNDVISTRYSIMGTSVINDLVVLIGHSHGGNVAIQTFNMLTEKFQSDVKNGILPQMPEMTLVTVNTPVRNDYQLTDDAKTAVDHVNVYADRDSVQLNGGNAANLGGANQTYKSAVNINYKDQIPITDKTGCGVTNHCGTAIENAKLWVPQAQSQGEVGRALERTLNPQ